MTVFLHTAGTLSLIYRIILIFHNRRPFFSLSWLWTAYWAACILCGLISYSSGNPVPAVIMTALTALAALTLLYFSSLMRKACRKDNTELKPDFITVLGAHVRRNTVTRVLVWRLEAAADEYEKHPDALIVTTGGRGAGENISEAEAEKLWLVKHGISEKCIIKENTSSSTYENLINTLALTGRPDAVYGIVTSDFHIYRALMTAHTAGLQSVYGIPAKTSALSWLHNTLRESLAICRYRIRHRR